MENIITQEMSQKAFDHINNRAHPVYGTFSEKSLGNPYANAAFANAIKELYNIDMPPVPSMEEIDSFRGKDEMVVISDQGYDYCVILDVVTLDNFDKYIEHFKNRIKRHGEDVMIQEVDKREDKVVYKCFLKDSTFYETFYYNTLKLNKFLNG